jgi:two-component system chemotaxis response regulator CheY
VKKILIVDDSESTRTSLTFYLKLKKFPVLTAKNGQEGLRMLQESGSEIGLIITDMNMPVMDGKDMVKKIREIPDYRALPVILLTTDEKLGDASPAFGVTAFILKSASTAEEIIHFIKTYLKWEC